jgi:hypothetical protein
MKKILDQFKVSIPWLIFENKNQIKIRFQTFQILFFKNQVRDRDFSQQRWRLLPIMDPDLLCHQRTRRIRPIQNSDSSQPSKFQEIF